MTHGADHQHTTNQGLNDHSWPSLFSEAEAVFTGKPTSVTFPFHLQVLAADGGKNSPAHLHLSLEI